MTRLAGERVNDLFALAESESARRGSGALPDRYVGLARKVGMRYNVRLLPEYRELYCRGCSTYWVEGRTVRTRLRSGRRVRTCLRCGRVRRTLVHPGETNPDAATPAPGDGLVPDEALAEAGVDDEDDAVAPGEDP
jgi:ribonuclease P protein subunit RPR2